MGMLKDFRDFAFKGNVIELAVAVIIGSAFGSIVSSLVEDVITPMLLSPALKAAKAEDLEHLSWGTVRYGKFIAAMINFLVIAAILFMLVKAAKRFSNEAETKQPSGPSASEKLLIEIRDALKK
jgi:large conductance mechanosensitive channel